MNTGALVFAFNNNSIDYVAIAVECAKRVNRHLDIPVTLVTDNTVDSEWFDRVIIAKKESGGSRYWHASQHTDHWFNRSRSSAYDLSPYENTLLLDCDYFINSSDLKSVIDAQQDFSCFHDNKYIPVTPHQETFGKTNTPHVWATVCQFTRNRFAESVFAAWQMIEENYDHYSKLFGFVKSPFRNDYALTLALLMINGGRIPSSTAIPWEMITLSQHCEFTLFNNSAEVTYLTDDKQKRVTVNNDIHVSDKIRLEAQCVE